MKPQLVKKTPYELAFILFCSALLFILHSSKVYASAMGYVRLDRTSIQQPVSGVICLEPSGANASQTSVSILFPNGFIIDPITSHWTTNTSTLPSGTTPWPGISLIATNVSGQSVTFSTNQLPSNTTTYCFGFNGGSGSSTGTNSSNDLPGTIITRNGSTTVDSVPYGLSLSDSGGDQISVTGSVYPRIEDFQFSFALTDGKQTNIPQNTILSYQISYGASSSANFSTNTTLVADFSNDQAPGGIDLLDYMNGSANNAYGNSPPVVDLIHKTITWKITNFPAGTTDQIITFQLRTNANYTNKLQSVPFTVKAHMSNQYLAIPEQIIEQSYKFTELPPTSPTINPIPQVTTPSPVPLEITNVEITNISQSSVSIQATTNEPSVVSLRYGPSLGHLQSTLTSPFPQQETGLYLNNLTPQTTYYFQIFAKDPLGKIVSSEIFTFTTAAISEAPGVAKGTVVFISGGNIIFSPNFAQGLFPEVTLPTNITYQVNFKILTSQKIKTIHLIMRNKKILGALSNSSLPKEQEISVLEIDPGVFLANLATPPVPNLYELYVHMIDNTGNLVEDKFAEVKVSNPIEVYNKESNTPIEHARLLLSICSNSLVKTCQLYPSTKDVTNPFFTDSNGKNNIVLPKGTYKLQVSALGFKEKEISFVLGMNTDKHGDYPRVYLEKEPFHLLTSITYYWTSFLDEANTFKLFMQNLSASSRFVELQGIMIVTLLIFLTFLSFAQRLRIPLHTLHIYFLHILNIPLHKSQTKQYNRSSFVATERFFVKELFAMLFESLLVVSFLFEIVFGFTLGWEKTMVFFSFSIINLFLWIIHVMYTKKESCGPEGN